MDLKNSSMSFRWKWDLCGMRDHWDLGIQDLCVLCLFLLNIRHDACSYSPELVRSWRQKYRAVKLLPFARNCFSIFKDLTKRLKFLHTTFRSLLRAFGNPKCATKFTSWNYPAQSGIVLSVARENVNSARRFDGMSSRIIQLCDRDERVRFFSATFALATHG